ncbi:hypothetical protein MKZ38_008609 [Zalerion maritima]|uniref:Uncharacterized protein n=1 Tax=Zalerion maritima TaxID=339359 RepID=A0AAD5WW05_9PEZI|nr:hypothetical protein MKZ38_008609 [Zalerion maritima]
MLPILALGVFASQTLALQNFTISNGQIFTPGIVVLDAPQPGTPLGGENLHVAIDVTANGRLQLPPYPDENPTQIFNITMFLYSYDTGNNFTISNGTEGAGGASIGEIMAQEDGSTVKHVNWIWPDCLVGDGQPQDIGSDRGVYNISIRQNFRLNGDDHYTIFDVPISVTNNIDEMDSRPSCDNLSNPILSPDEVDVEGANNVGTLFAPGDATEVETFSNTDEASDGGSSEGLGPEKPDAEPSDGLGGAGSLSPIGTTSWICVAGMFMSLL